MDESLPRAEVEPKLKQIEALQRCGTVWGQEMVRNGNADGLMHKKHVTAVGM